MRKLNYNTDNVWNDAKNVARMNGFSNQWIEIIDYYNSKGGEHVQIFVVFDAEKHRLLYLMDSGKVLLINKKKELVIKSYSVVNESKKIFFYKEETEVKEIELPEEERYLGKEKVTIKV